MNLLITGAWNGASAHISELEQMGHQVAFLQYEADPLPCPYDWVEGVIGNGLFLHHPIDLFPKLRYIQLTSAGFDRVDMNYVNQSGIKIFNARGVYSIPMAEFALCGVLQLYKQSRFFQTNQQKHSWEKHRSLLELCGAHVCIIGCGSVGTECAKRFSALGCHVTGVDLYPTDNPAYTDILSLSELDIALHSADIVVLTLPLTEQTHHLFNEARFTGMKDDAVLVNIARGSIVDTEALIRALDGKLFGAVLDVFDSEPLGSDSPLWDLENVVLTPHNSFVSDKNAERLYHVIIENLKVC